MYWHVLTFVAFSGTTFVIAAGGLRIWLASENDTQFSQSATVVVGVAVGLLLAVAVGVGWDVAELLPVEDVPVLVEAVLLLHAARNNKKTNARAAAGRACRALRVVTPFFQEGNSARRMLERANDTVADKIRIFGDENEPIWLQAPSDTLFQEKGLKRCPQPFSFLSYPC
jgi:hypothetical protein